MFVNTNQAVGVSQRVVATLVACATVLFSLGIYHTAQAANYTNVSDLITDSAPSATAGHTISFTVPTGSSIGTGDTITLTFDASFGGVASTLVGDLTVTANAVGQSIGGFSSDATTISFNNVAAAAGQEVVVAIADGKITNPGAVGSYQVSVTNGTDTASTMVAVVDTVTVSASIDTLFTFTVSGVDNGTAINGETTTGTTSTTTIDFGEIAADTQYVMGQELSVSTNAINGFSVTVETDGNLRSANGADIDTFHDGTDENTAGNTWSGNVPSATVGQEATYGHWGMTYEDTTLQGGVVLGANEYIAASTTPRQVFYHNGPAASAETGTGTARVAYSVQISPLQEAADDYTSVLTYIATPTF